MRGEAAGRRNEQEEGCDASVRDCGVVWAGGRSMMHGRAATGLASASWVSLSSGKWWGRRVKGGEAGWGIGDEAGLCHTLTHPSVAVAQVSLPVVCSLTVVC